MSFIPVIQYIVGIGVFGFIYWLLDNILDDFIAVGIHETGNLYDFMMYGWAGALLIYLFFGGWWVIRKYNEIEYRGGF